MTATSTASASRPAPRPASRPAGSAPPEEKTQEGPGQALGTALQDLLAAGIERLAKAAADKVEDLAGSLEHVASSGGTGGGVLAKAAVAGGVAWAQGRNPVWAALTAGVSAMSVPARVGLALLLVLTAVLAPVLVLVLAVALLVAAAVGAVAS